MKTKNFIKQLSEELDRYFVDFNFSCKVSYKDSAIILTQNTEYGYRRILINILSKYDYIKTEISTGVRFEEVEDLFHQASEFTGNSAKNTTTIGCNLKKYAPDREEIYFLRNENIDTLKIASIIKKYYEKYISKFFKKYDNLKIIDKELNQDLEQIPIIKFNLSHRAKTSIIVACLTENENYNEIVKFFRKKLEDLADGFYLPDYEKLVEILQDY